MQCKRCETFGGTHLPHIVKTVLYCLHDVPSRLSDLGQFLIQQLPTSDGADGAVRLVERIPSFLSGFLLSRRRTTAAERVVTPPFVDKKRRSRG